jgi:hypothetical protein
MLWWQIGLLKLSGIECWAHKLGAAGRDHNRLTPDLLAGFAVMLGIPVGDLAALGDVRLPNGGVPAHSVPADMAVLIWEVRRLTAEQVRQVLDEANSMSRGWRNISRASPEGHPGRGWTFAIILFRAPRRRTVLSAIRFGPSSEGPAS